MMYGVPNKIRAMHKNKFDYSMASSNAPADSSTVHLVFEYVMDSTYGSERRNEIFAVQFVDGVFIVPS